MSDLQFGGVVFLGVLGMLLFKDVRMSLIAEIKKRKNNGKV
jgi:hypothetical protein